MIPESASGCTIVETASRESRWMVRKLRRRKEPDDSRQQYCEITGQKSDLGRNRQASQRLVSKFVGNSPWNLEMVGIHWEIIPWSAFSVHLFLFLFWRAMIKRQAVWVSCCEWAAIEPLVSGWIYWILITNHKLSEIDTKPQVEHKHIRAFPPLL